MKARKKIKVRLKSDSPTEQQGAQINAASPPLPPPTTNTLQRFRPPQNLPPPPLPGQATRSNPRPPRPFPVAPRPPQIPQIPVASSRRLVGVPRIPASARFAPPFFRPGGMEGMPYPNDPGASFTEPPQMSRPLLDSLSKADSSADLNPQLSSSAPNEHLPIRPPPPLLNQHGAMFNHHFLAPSLLIPPPHFSMTFPPVAPSRPDEPPAVDEVWPPLKWVPQSLNTERVLFGSLVGYLATKGTWPTRMCFTCGCPIAIFGWLTPCRHLYCLSCADFMKKANKCGRCSAIVVKVESMDFDEDAAALISECPVPQCVQAFFDQSSLQNHLSLAHPRFRAPLGALPGQSRPAEAATPPDKDEPRPDPLPSPLPDKQDNKPPEASDEGRENPNDDSGRGRKRPLDEGNVLVDPTPSHLKLTNEPTLASVGSDRTEELDRSSETKGHPNPAS